MLHGEVILFRLANAGLRRQEGRQTAGFRQTGRQAGLLGHSYWPNPSWRSPACAHRTNASLLTPAAHPVHLPHLIGPFEHYLWILKTTHSGKRRLPGWRSPPFGLLLNRCGAAAAQPGMHAVLGNNLARSPILATLRGSTVHCTLTFSPPFCRRRPRHQLHHGAGPDGWGAGLDHRGWVATLCRAAPPCAMRCSVVPCVACCPSTLPGPFPLRPTPVCRSARCPASGQPERQLLASLQQPPAPCPAPALTCPRSRP